MRDSTIVVVTADHGEEFAEHGRLRHGPHLYDETVHVPLVVAGPGVGAGRSDVLAQGIDFFPTIAALLGIPTPVGLPGQNLLAAPAMRAAISESPSGVARDGTRTALVSLRTDRWKLIAAPALGRFELYDLARDPAERNDLYGFEAEGAALADELARWTSSAPAPPPVAGRDPRLGEKLRALGYVE
jgi:arylsulfatase A-like enzyme